ncbi:hypothetical protein F2Q70_00004460 [Brassica cretica]|uniref:Uncharacterized protein n=1 Tax=Brassica cretica TaxID=69181 RepID=A0A8S9IV92_BRACR|nr:hypothetical protein F2Q70_00004460 [Brassica cretica]
MSSGNSYRSWMDKPHLDPNTRLLTQEYAEGVGEFMRLVQQQPEANTGCTEHTVQLGGWPSRIDHATNSVDGRAGSNTRPAQPSAELDRTRDQLGHPPSWNDRAVTVPSS